MWIIKICLLLFVILFLPYQLGKIVFKQNNNRNEIQEEKNSKEMGKPGINIIAGWFLMLTLFQIIAVPVIILQQPFSILVILYSVALGIALCFSLTGWIADFFSGQQKLEKIMPGKRFIAFWKGKWNLEKVGVISGYIIIIFLLLFQITATVELEHYDGDDAYYVAASVATDLYDTMYVRDNYTGYQFTLESRHALSPMPVFIAWMSRMTGIHATILSHSILGPFWIILMYLIYWELSGQLLKEKKQYRPWFMAFLMLWFLFGNVSIYTVETFSLTRIWQGKGFMTAIVIPAIFLGLCLYEQKVIRQEKATNEWLFLLCCNFVAILATSTSIFLTPIFMGCAALLLFCKQRKIQQTIQLLLSVLPAFVYGILYMILR